MPPVASFSLNRGMLLPFIGIFAPNVGLFFPLRGFLGCGRNELSLWSLGRAAPQRRGLRRGDFVPPCVTVGAGSGYAVGWGATVLQAVTKTASPFSGHFWTKFSDGVFCMCFSLNIGMQLSIFVGNLGFCAPCVSLGAGGWAGVHVRVVQAMTKTLLGLSSAPGSGCARGGLSRGTSPRLCPLPLPAHCCTQHEEGLPFTAIFAAELPMVLLL